MSTILCMEKGPKYPFKNWKQQKGRSIKKARISKSHQFLHLLGTVAKLSSISNKHLIIKRFSVLYWTEEKKEGIRRGKEVFS